MTVHAPFRFSPINRWVYFPDWADLVSHDVPFSDGYSGSIKVRVTAMKPVTVGGARRAAGRPGPNGQTLPGEVRPFRLASGRYAVPGSSWQGLFRSVLEIAAFGKLADKVEARRFGFRDISSTATADLYKNRMTTGSLIGGGVMRIAQHAQPGWLIRTSEFSRVIVPCKVARVPFAEIRSLRAAGPGTPGDLLDQRSFADQRYDWFGTLADLNRTAQVTNTALPNRHQNGALRIDYHRAYATVAAAPVGAVTSARPITLIFTGKPQNGLGNRCKKMEFAFYSPDRPAASATAAGALPIEKDVWDDFRLIHEAQPGREANPNWAFWASEFHANRPVPVFYLVEGGKVTTLGTAFMFKTAQPLSTHDMLRNSSAFHDDPRADVPALLFGAVADDVGGGLKRRVSFDMAPATLPTNGALHTSQPLVLLSPKPSYFGLYVRQPGDGDQLPIAAGARAPYATYDDLSAPGRFANPKDLWPEHTAPELNGVKVWPAQASLQPPGAGPGGATIRTRLHALPVGTVFDVEARFHNIREVELGALLWALTLGEETKLAGPGTKVHRIGMGKPYGYGAISVSIAGISLAYAPHIIDKRRFMSEAMKAFVDHMELVYADSGDGGGWLASVQAQTVLRAGEPAPGLGLDLRYMTLGEGTHPPLDSYRGWRADGRFLPRFAPGGEAPRGGGAFPPGGGPNGGGAAVARKATAEDMIVDARVRLGEDGDLGVVTGVTGEGKNRRYTVRLQSGKSSNYPLTLLWIAPE